MDRITNVAAPFFVFFLRPTLKFNVCKNVTRIGRLGGRFGDWERCGTCHITVDNGQWIVDNDPINTGQLSIFRYQLSTELWHVPHLKQAAFSRAELVSRERAFSIRGTRFWPFVARFDGVKNSPILGQNDTYPTHSDCFSDGSASPTHPDPPTWRSCRLLHRPMPFWSRSRNDQELLAERRGSRRNRGA